MKRILTYLFLGIVYGINISFQWQHYSLFALFMLVFAGIATALRIIILHEELGGEKLRRVDIYGGRLLMLIALACLIVPMLVK